MSGLGGLLRCEGAALSNICGLAAQVQIRIVLPPLSDSSIVVRDDATIRPSYLDAW